MLIITCPNCHSKFRFAYEAVAPKTIKMRCSVCTHIFEHTIEPEASLEKEFETLLSSQDMQKPSAEQDFSDEDFSQEITETPSEEEKSAEAGSAESSPEAEMPGVQPESVMREIDSILGAGSEISEEEVALLTPQKPNRSKFYTITTIVLVLVIGAASLWIFKEKIPFLGKSSHLQNQTSLLERGPFFHIEEDSITHELLSHDKEGSVLVIRGKVRKLTPKAVDSILLEARLFDKSGKLLESRLAYAGIIPDSSEFARQESKDIDALLTSQPATSGSSMPSENIPFAVAFFGKSTQEGASFQVEVKEFHWK
jgi:predicted Zn finger-like uncharacterized protein